MRRALARLTPVAVIAASCVLTGCGTSPADEAHRRVQELHAASEPSHLVARGRVFAAAGDDARAEEYFVAALDAGASSEHVIGPLLAACVHAGKLRVAAQYARGHLERHPADVRTRTVLGTLHAALGDARSAEDELGEAIRRAPRSASLRYTLAVILRDVGHDSRGADREFRHYLRLAPAGAHADEARESLLRQVEDAAGLGLVGVAGAAEAGS